jgi:hypothetical protein
MKSKSLEPENETLHFLNGSVKMANNDGRRPLPIMVRPGRKSHKPYWPFMELWGLHRKVIESDGMCTLLLISSFHLKLVLICVPDRKLPVSSLVGSTIRHH